MNELPKSMLEMSSETVLPKTTTELFQDNAIRVSRELQESLKEVAGKCGASVSELENAVQELKKSMNGTITITPPDLTPYIPGIGVPIPIPGLPISGRSDVNPINIPLPEMCSSIPNHMRSASVIGGKARGGKTFSVMDGAEVGKIYMVLTCPTCSAQHTTIQIDEATLALCTNRKMKRAYVSIGEGIKDKWYLCPTCHNHHKTYAWHIYTGGNNREAPNVTE